MTDIAITGMGIISPIGIGWESFCDSLKEVRSGIEPLTIFQCPQDPPPLVGQIADFDPKLYLGNKGIRHFDRTALMVTSAAKMALADAEWEEYPPEEAGVVLGSTFGVIDSIAFFDTVALKDGVNYVNPMSFPNTVINAAASRISIACNAKGLCSTISTGEGSALDALIYAAEFLSWNRSRFLLTGGGYGLGPMTFWGLHEGGLLGTYKSGEYPRPFGIDRKGAVLGEGSCMAVLERADDALARGVEPLMYLQGFATGFYPLDEEDSFITGGAHIVEKALLNAEIEKESVSCVMAQANGNVLQDRLEARILDKVFGPVPVPVTSIKGYTGECLDAGGAFSLAAALYCLQKRSCIPVWGGYQAGEDCPVNLIKEKAKITGNNILIIGFSYTGNFSAVVVSRSN